MDSCLFLKIWVENSVKINISNIIGKIIEKEISSITGSGITLANNEIKDIIKLIKS